MELYILPQETHCYPHKKKRLLVMLRKITSFG